MCLYTTRLHNREVCIDKKSMAQKNKRPGRRDYLNQFKMDDSGIYSYQGTYMEYGKEEADWKRDLIRIWLCCVIPLAFLLVVGFVPDSGLAGNLLILLPYGLEVIALFALIWKVIRITYGGRRIRKYVHDKTIKVLPGYAAAVLITAIFGLAGMIVVPILGKYDGAIYALVIFILGQLLSGAGALWIQKIAKDMFWIEK